MRQWNVVQLLMKASTVLGKQFKTTIRHKAKPETGWVLVKDDPGYGLAYLSIRFGLWYWSHNNLDALRMARKEDAEALKMLWPAARAEEHQWG
jgi:hypothetical protein